MSNAADVIQAVREACREAGSQKEWAKAKGFHPSFVSEVLNGRTDISERLLEALGWEIHYRKKR